MYTVEIDNVTKAFGKTVAVDKLSLSVPKGSIYGFIGPNGSGKTTTLRMIMNIFFPDTGAISVFGEKLHGASHDRIGYLHYFAAWGIIINTEISWCRVYVNHSSSSHNALIISMSEQVNRLMEEPSETCTSHCEINTGLTAINGIEGLWHFDVWLPGDRPNIVKVVRKFMSWPVFRNIHNEVQVSPLNIH